MAGVPCVFTRSGVMHDLDPTRLKGVIAVPFKDSSAIEQAALHWLEHPPTREEREAFAEHNARYLASTIDISHRVKALTELYEQV
jgi:glycosyltransferase involved in cell wall biosynthesis